MSEVRNDLWQAVERWVGGLSDPGPKLKYRGPFHRYQKTTVDDMAAEFRELGANLPHLRAVGLGTLPGNGRVFILLNVSEDATFYGQKPDTYMVLKQGAQRDVVALILEGLINMAKGNSFPAKPKKEKFWHPEPRDLPMIEVVRQLFALVE